MKRILLRSVFFLIIIFPAHIYAVEKSKEDVKNKSFSRINTILVLEGIILLNADFASRDPLGYGAITFLLGTTFGGVKRERTVDKYIYAGFTSIMLYNMTLNRSKVSKSEVFNNKLILWNLLLISGTLFESDDKRKTIQIEAMSEGGAKLEFKYKF